MRDLLGDLDPADCKLHCAVWNGEKHPIDLLANSWDEWVSWSRWRGKKDEFSRPLIFSMAQSRAEPSRWLFGGVFEVTSRRPEPGTFAYDLALRTDHMTPYVKRLEVAFRLRGRTTRLNFETWIDQMEVASVLRVPYTGEPFPGHDQINHTLGELEIIVEQQRHDWRDALVHMKGVYVIHDQTTGRPYVGSAYGDTGIWTRLSQYATSLHGGNVGLRELVGEHGNEYARANLRFALLEFWSMRTSDDHVLAREGYWKDVMLSRRFGNNRN